MSNPMFDRLSPEMTVKGVSVFARIHAVWHDDAGHYVVDRVAYGVADRPEVEERMAVGTIRNTDGGWRVERPGGRRSRSKDIAPGYIFDTPTLAAALDWAGTEAARVIANRIDGGQIRVHTPKQEHLYWAAEEFLEALTDVVPTTTIDDVVEDARKAVERLARHAYRVRTADVPREAEVPA